MFISAVNVFKDLNNHNKYNNGRCMNQIRSSFVMPLVNVSATGLDMTSKRLTQQKKIENDNCWKSRDLR